MLSTAINFSSNHNHNIILNSEYGGTSYMVNTYVPTFTDKHAVTIMLYQPQIRLRSYKLQKNVILYVCIPIYVLK